MNKLRGNQRRYLRGLAHGLKPVVQVGKSGLSEGLLQSVDTALDHHELIKVRFVDFKSQKKEIAAQIDARLGCERVGMVGHVVIFYRPISDPEARHIALPAADERAGVA